MNYGAEYDLLVQAIRAVFVIGAPIVIAAAVAGTVASVLQSAMTLSEPAVGYAVRLVAVVAVIYLMFPTFAKLIVLLAETAWGP
jgi:type III secretory pathway component EscS